MRGKRSVPGTVRREPRITPAHAGKTDDSYIPGTDTTDHPRACGENVRRRYSYRLHAGSPPRMRGKLADFHDPYTLQRITPAHAGKTFM